MYAFYMHHSSGQPAVPLVQLHVGKCFQPRLAASTTAPVPQAEDLTPASVKDFPKSSPSEQRLPSEFFRRSSSVELAPRTPLVSTPGSVSDVLPVSCKVGNGLPSAGGVEERLGSLECHGGHARRPAIPTRILAFKRWAQGRCFRCLA
jgi:hypothetical protein